MYCCRLLRCVLSQIGSNSYRLDGVWHNVSCDDYFPLLANAIHSVNCLRLHHRVPVRLDEMYVIRHCKVKSGEEN
jgi:hypothetical protein